MMPGFYNVSNMTSRQIQRMGHADDNGSDYYRAKTKTNKVVVNHNADDVWNAACAAQREYDFRIRYYKNKTIQSYDC
jgi:hypothetical protein